MAPDPGIPRGKATENCFGLRALGGTICSIVLMWEEIWKRVLDELEEYVVFVVVEDDEGA